MGINVYGKYNFTAVGKDIPSDSFFADLSEPDQRYALKLGRSLADAEAARKAKETETKVKNVTERVKKRGKGVVSFEKGVVAKTEMQKKGVSLAKHLASVLGIEIVFYDSKKDAAHANDNGWYDRANNSIHIDINAGGDYRGTIAYTLGHELAHFINEWSPAKFKTFSDFLIQQYGEHGKSVQEMLEAQMAKLGTKDVDIAMEELVADACETMLLDSNAVEKLTQLRMQDATLYDKIKQFVQKILNRLKEMYKDIDPDSAEAKSLREMTDVFEQISDMFSDAAVDAANHYQNSESVAVGNADRSNVALAGEDVSYSLRNGAETDVENALTDLSRRDDIYLTESSPSIIATQKGVRNLPMLMKASHIRENIYTEAEAKRLGLNVDEHTHYHGLGKELFLKIIGGLDDVTLAYRGTKKAADSNRRENYFLLISQYKDADGNTINVPVYINERGQYNRVFIETNKIATVFGRNNLNDYISREVKNGNLMRIKNKSDQASERTALIAGGYSKSAFTDTTVPQKAQSVNTIISENAKNDTKKYDVDQNSVDESNSDIQYSKRVTDKDTLRFLNSQETVTTYKAMQIIDGKLYPPMAAKVKGEDGKYHLTNPSELGVWQEAVEDPANIKVKGNGIGYYTLNKGNGKSIQAAYNPYEHSSNLVLNDQFEEAYQRSNLVTVECVIPKSELSGKYKAEFAKDPTGMLDWKSGVVAGQIKDNKRMVYLSRWLKPVRVLSDAETAKLYKKAIGSDISVPFNVVTPGLRTELEKIGVSIDYEGTPSYKAHNRSAVSSVYETDVKKSTRQKPAYDVDFDSPINV